MSTVTMMTGSENEKTSSQKNRAVTRKPPSWRLLLAIFLFFIGALLLMEWAGERARTYRPVPEGHVEIRVVRTSAQLYRYWQRLGLQGRIVVHAGRYLHYVDDEEHPLGYAAPPSYPVTVTSVRGEREKRVDHTNLLWLAVQANIARCLYMVMTPADFTARFTSGTDTPPRERDGSIRVHDFGAPRIILDAIPRVGERVVLNMDASYFSGDSGGQLLQSLRDGKLHADVITLCLSEDNPDVTASERVRALETVQNAAAASKGAMTVVNLAEGLSE